MLYSDAIKSKSKSKLYHNHGTIINAIVNCTILRSDYSSMLQLTFKSKTFWNRSQAKEAATKGVV